MLERIGEDSDEFKEFVRSGYDADKVLPNRILHIASEFASHMNPAFTGSYDEQQIRKAQWPALFVGLVSVLQHAYWEAQDKIRSQREELIEIKKELSALKRAKK